MNTRHLLKIMITMTIGKALAQFGSAFPLWETSAVDGISQKLYQAAVNKALNPRLRADCADLASKLGYHAADLHAFVLIPNAETPAFMIGRYPVTNSQYARFLKAENFSNPQWWCNLLRFSEMDESGEVRGIGDWGNEGWEWLQKQDKKDGIYFPPAWDDGEFGAKRPHAPVVGITWWEASAYCRWLQAHWDELPEGQQGLPKPIEIRLPTESEWVMAAGGAEDNRFAWGKLENGDDIIHFANTSESKIGRTTPVWMYPQGESRPFKLMDISGNVWEWQANYAVSPENGWQALQGGSYYFDMESACIANRSLNDPQEAYTYTGGFRVVGLFSPPS
ncbi:MAG TPA: SUMF1/EgtB/PvdO family nonheme iron enzyme [Anaerolineaceae bacterium]|nr:SUMF1/EgtB/PvdO family nonheme iron enzyme [Anaerolineaceae bacterium]HPN54251.1 SUMF1/EgtB/PvdO family nonheme iron enzyme [Anaerolineaceae bacterium]